MKQLLMAVICLFPLIPVAQSVQNDVRNGDTCFNRKQYAKAYTYYSSAANKGDEYAALKIGEMIYRNKISGVDYKEAMEWFQRAAGKGNREAMTYMAIIYDLGYSGVPQDLKRAKGLYEQAINQGDIRAINNLSSFYKTGKHGLLPRDFAKEEQCYKRSMEAGLDVGYTNLASYYATQSLFTYDLARTVSILREGIKKRKVGCASLLVAYYLSGRLGPVGFEDIEAILKEGVGYGDNNAKSDLGIMYLRQNENAVQVRKGLQLVEEAAIENAEASFFLGKAYCGIFNESVKSIDKGIEQIKRAFSNGHSKAGIFLSLIYDKGAFGVTVNHELADKFFEEAIALMPSDILTTLGVSYANGNEEGIDISYDKANKIFRKAIEMGNTNAMYNLANAYCEGRGVSKSYPKAMELYQRAIKAGSAEGMYGLALMYRRGEGVEKPDYQKAVELYLQAVDAGNDNAAYNLALMYESGNGVPVDLIKARELYEKAANWGDAEAMNKLGLMLINGQGVSKDKAKAGLYFKKACSLNFEEACSNYHDLIK